MSDHSLGGFVWFCIGAGVALLVIRLAIAFGVVVGCACV